MRLLLLVALAVPAQARIVDRVVAVVNDEVIAWSELEDMLRPTLEKLGQITDPVSRAQEKDRFLRKGLDELVGQRLVLQQAATLKVTVGVAEVDAHIDQIKASRGWDDEQMRIYLTAQGMHLADFRREVRNQLLRNKVVRMKLISGVQVSPVELEAHYKDELTKANTNFEVEAAHIVLPVPNEATPAESAATEREAKELLARAQAGEDFTELAKRYSKGPGAARGGYLGTVRKGSLDPGLEKALFALPDGAVGGPVRTRFGYHVIRAMKRKKLDPPPFEEVEGRLRVELQNKKLQEALEKWVEELKEKAFIEIRL